MIKLPNLIIAGVPNAATTSLYSYFSKHPEVFTPTKKEINYFRALKYNKELDELHQYEQHFLSSKDEKYRLDASPQYLYGGDVIISKMKELLPEHKVIIILRNPVDRFISYYNYLFLKRSKIADKNLSSFLEKCLSGDKAIANNIWYSRALYEGNYICYLPKWVDAYQSSLKIIFFEDLKSNPRAVMIELAKWLEVNIAPFENLNYTIENKTPSVKHTTLHFKALRVKENIEIFLHPSKKVKNFLKKIYYIVNSRQEGKPELDEESVKKLHEIYNESNKKLRAYLQEKEFQIPLWLEENVKSR